MPTNADASAANEPGPAAVDTSVAIAALDSAHSAHTICRSAVMERRPALAGHAVFETYSVLTRMPGQLHVDGPTAADLIDRVFPDRFWLDAPATAALFANVGALGITGGAVYDALVGAATQAAGAVLLTRDLRARRTYDLLGVDYQLLL